MTPPPTTDAQQTVRDAIVAYIDRREDAFIDRLRKLVDTNSGLDNPVGRLDCLAQMDRFYRLLGFATERIERPGDMVHLIARRPAASSVGGTAPKVLLLGHLDTVFDSTSGFLSFQRVGEWATGPGVGDMKGGLIVIQAAIEALARVRHLDDFDWLAVHNADEEIQSPTSRELIEKYAVDRDLALDFEVGRPSGALVRARAGVGRYFVRAHGHAAHSGMRHADGANAIVALAAVIAELAALTDYERGTTVNVGTINGGTKRNIVPDDARCEVDVRIRDAAEGERIDAAVRAICARQDVPGTWVEVMGGIGRPPWRPFAGSEHLTRLVLATAEELGVHLDAEETGGGSDANFTAALGIPTVDGLGPIGEDVHTDRERIRLYSVAERAKLVACSLLAWTPPSAARA